MSEQQQYIEDFKKWLGENPQALPELFSFLCGTMILLSENNEFTLVAHYFDGTLTAKINFEKDKANDN